MLLSFGMEENVVTEAGYYKMEMECVQGEHLFSLVTSAIHYWHYDLLGGVDCFPHAML